MWFRVWGTRIRGICILNYKRSAPLSTVKGSLLRQILTVASRINGRGFPFGILSGPCRDYTMLPTRPISSPLTISW